MKVGIKLGKVKKFGIGWYIPHRVMGDNAEWGSHGIGLIWRNMDLPCNHISKSLLHAIVMDLDVPS